MDNNVRYEKMECLFKQGEVYRNFNGNEYRVMEKYSDNNMLFMDMNTGKFVVGVDVECFVRYPEGEKESPNKEVGIEWGHGVYLGNTPSLIDFKALREKYGPEKENVFEIETFLGGKER